MPVVSAPPSPPQDQDEELTFTCRSTDGYPRPNVYWINRTDNSLLSEALHNSTVALNSRGLYDVVSVLRVPWAPNLDVGCCIENVLLNLTVSSQAETGTARRGPRWPHPGRGPGPPGELHGQRTVRRSDETPRLGCAGPGALCNHAT